MTDLPKRLRIKASMIALGERIAWGSDTALMEEAADVIEALIASVENHQLHMLGMARDRDQLRAMLSEQQQASAAQSAPAGEREAVAYVLTRDGEVCYEADDGIVISNTPGDETDLCKWQPVYFGAAQQRTQSAGVPGLRHTDQWESARVADYNAGWNDRHTAEFSRLTDEQIFDIAEPFGEFRYGDASGDKRIAFARAIIAALAAAPAQPAAHDQGEVREAGWVNGFPPAGELCEARIPHHTSEGMQMLWCEVEVIAHAIIKGVVYSWVKEPGPDGSYYAPLMLSFRRIDAALAASTGQEV